MAETTETPVVIENVSYPPYIAKMMEKIDVLKVKVANQKKEVDDMNAEIKQLEKIAEKVVKKMMKTVNKPKKVRKPSGFALPVKVTNELCDFMGVPHGTEVARTNVTQHLMKYVDEKGLKNPEKKSVIIPDAALARLLGPDAKDVVVTHFTIQKYINRHFVKA